MTVFAISVVVMMVTAFRRGGCALTFNVVAASLATRKPVVEAGPPEIAKDKTLTVTGCANAAVTTVEETVGEVRPLGIAQYGASTESEIAVSSGEAGSSWP